MKRLYSWIAALSAGVVLAFGTALTGIAPQAGFAQEKASDTMDEKKAVQLVAEAKKRLQYVLNGGTHKPGKQPESFVINGQYYRYLGEDLDTMAELRSYLSAVLAPSATNTFIKQYRIISHNGKLAQPDADGGDLREWTKAQATFVKGNNSFRYYELKVPYGEAPDIQFDIVQASFMNIPGRGWKVLTMPGLAHYKKAGKELAFTVLINSAVPGADEEKLPGEVKQWLEEKRKTEGTWFADFQGKTYALIARGEKPHPGFGITVKSVMEYPDYVEVSYSYEEPSPSALYPAVITYPAVVIELAQPSSKKIHFRFQESSQ